MCVTMCVSVCVKGGGSRVCVVFVSMGSNMYMYKGKGLAV